MSTYADGYREASKAKLKRMLADPETPVDASGYTPPGPELGMIQTGERPVTRARFRSGGSITGGKTTARLDRKPRSTPMSADDYLNRDVRMANEERAGIKHDGGFARGGIARDGRARAHKFMGGPMQGGASPYAAQGAPQALRPGYASGGKVHEDAAQDKKLIKSELAKHGADCTCARCSGGRAKKASGGPINDGTRPKGGRMPHARGGAAKKGTTVNIIIAPPKAAALPMPPPGMAAPPKGIPAPPPAAMAAPAGGAPGAAMPPASGAPPLMGRKSGGRTSYPIKDGAGGAEGRLQKIKAYG